MIERAIGDVRGGVVLGAFVLACGSSGGPEFEDGEWSASVDDGVTPTTSGSSTGGTTGASTTSGSSSGADTTDGFKFDQGVPPGLDLGVLMPTCEVVDDMDAVGDCSDEAPNDAFEPVT